MSQNVTLSVCSLNQWCLDFQGNYERIVKSIQLSREQNSTYRLGSELEITGYGCGDHFFEQDTVLHSWQVGNIYYTLTYCW